MGFGASSLRGLPQRPIENPLLGGESSDRSRWASTLRAASQPPRLLTSTARACEEHSYSYVCALQPRPLGAFRLVYPRCSVPHLPEAGVTMAPLRDLAKLLKTSQQQISRLESPGYEGHSLSTLRRVADALHARLRIVFEPAKPGNEMRIAESAASYGAKRGRPKRR